jgi:glc operon protein GlcG
MRAYGSLGHDLAAVATEAIRDELARRAKPAVIAVADVHGELISLVRLDGASPASVLIATNKAWTAARERQPTHDIGQMARDAHAGFDMAYYVILGTLGGAAGCPS